jgi:hypothetical protein
MLYVPCVLVCALSANEVESPPNDQTLQPVFYHTIVNSYVLDFAQDNNNVLCENPKDGHTDRNI